MVRARIVFDLVLDELEAGEPDGIERKVIGAAGIRKRERLGAQVAEGREPLAKQICDPGVSLQINAANLPGAAIEIEVAGESLIFRHFYQCGRRRRAARGAATVAVARPAAGSARCRRDRLEFA